jgi:hypothetical protein
MVGFHLRNSVMKLAHISIFALWPRLAVDLWNGRFFAAVTADLGWLQRHR